ncbi:nuclear transport factor 2 family protein [Streptomyces sp. SID11385]|uniref:nuclear transport factor 2 family protein n=1 Tax=Streptomyces sp. SID11385 TaxID=2706031 RepID=UPI0013CBB6BA|nr:nuclear transport factor 2 family protein [Streptomyces sp. SID11385]NEA44211.1 nuclear transport factor 2 family protein [Streptomyces sp. SID11385]
MTVQQDPRLGAFAADHLAIQNFYARQMHCLDEGRVDDWAATFTPDGTFAANAHPEPYTGRPAIAEGARAAHRALREAGVRRRHWLGMLAVEPRADGSVFARSYAQILEIPSGGPARLLLSTTCEDVLVRDGGSWLVRDRQVRRDDLT